MEGAPPFRLTPRTVLVTGATGWLGQRLVAALGKGAPDSAIRADAGVRLRCLVPVDQRGDALRAAGAEVVPGDLRDPDAVAQFVAGADGATLLHLAGVIHPPGRTWWFDAVNHRAAADLFEAAHRSGIARVVAMSSNSPIGATKDHGLLFDEESPFHPYMGYGRSKQRMEQALSELARREGAPELVILRAPWFYGPCQPARQSLFFTLIRKGRFPIVGDGTNRRSMAYVDNLVQGIVRAAATPAAAGEVFWIADEMPYTMNEIIETVRDVLRDDFGLDVSPRCPRLPGIVADVARLADATLQGIGLYQQKIHVLSEMNLTIACRVDKARRMLGYVPTVALRDGMRKSIAWCLENGIEV